MQQAVPVQPWLYSKEKPSRKWLRVIVFILFCEFTPTCTLGITKNTEDFLLFDHWETTLNHGRI